MKSILLWVMSLTILKCRYLQVSMVETPQNNDSFRNGSNQISNLTLTHPLDQPKQKIGNTSEDLATNINAAQILNNSLEVKKSDQKPTLPIQILINQPQSLQNTKTVFQRTLTDKGLSTQKISSVLRGDAKFKVIKSLDFSSTISENMKELKQIFRSYNGSFNNKINGQYGSTNETLIRKCRANYLDGRGTPVSDLKSAREVSNLVGAIRNSYQKNKDNVTFLFTIWGQFIDHDIVHIPSSKTDSMIIRIPRCDKFLDSDCNGQRSIPFGRSLFSNKSTTRLPFSDITVWIDGSMIYGSTDIEAKNLRSFNRGQLKVSQIDGRLLPSDSKVSGQKAINESATTMKAGDSRSNQNLILLSLQTLFLRQHNRLCDLVLRKYPVLTDQQVYQIARNYVIGLIQKITYDDFLPIVLGQQRFDEHVGQYKGYKDGVDPALQVEFAGAGYRFGHSLVVPNFPMVNIFGEEISRMRLDDAYFRPDLFNSVAMERILRGTSRIITKSRDGQFVDQLRNLLVLAPEIRTLRMDLLALNIQRGRDLGLQSYNAMRQCYGLKKYTNFSQIAKDSAKISHLKQAYQSIDKIDSYVGIQIQEGLEGGILGQLGSLIVGQSFRRLRDGDRFWYESVLPVDVVSEIKGTKLSHIIMRNTAIQEIQQDVFHYHFSG